MVGAEPCGEAVGVTVELQLCDLDAAGAAFRLATSSTSAAARAT
jgi:hypothetical protein